MPFGNVLLHNRLPNAKAHSLGKKNRNVHTLTHSNENLPLKGTSAGVTVTQSRETGSDSVPIRGGSREASSTGVPIREQRPRVLCLLLRGGPTPAGFRLHLVRVWAVVVYVNKHRPEAPYGAQTPWGIDLVVIRCLRSSQPLCKLCASSRGVCAAARTHNRAATTGRYLLSGKLCLYDLVHSLKVNGHLYFSIFLYLCLDEERLLLDSRFLSVLQSHLKKQTPNHLNPKVWMFRNPHIFTGL